MFLGEIYNMKQCTYYTIINYKRQKQYLHYILLLYKKKALKKLVKVINENAHTIRVLGKLNF